MSTKTGADRSSVIEGESRYHPPEYEITVTANIEEQMIKYAMMLSVKVEEWKLNSVKGGRVLNMTPTQLVMLNSVRTSKCEEERARCAGKFMRNIVNVPNKVLSQFRDGAYWIEVKKGAIRQRK